MAIASQIQALHVAQQTEQQNRPIPRYPQTLAELLDNTQTPQIFLMQVSYYEMYTNMKPTKYFITFV